MKDVVFFPGEFKLIGELRRGSNGLKPALAASWNKNAIRRIIEKKKGFTMITIPYGKTPCFLALRGFHIYKPPKISNSPTSRAIYYARSEDKQNGLLIQYLPPYSRTSKHYHEQQTEAYYLIAGSVEIETNCAVIPLKVPGVSQVTILPGKPGSPHPLITYKEPALTLLQIVNCPGGLSMEDHHYLE